MPENRLTPQQLLDRTDHRPFPLPEGRPWIMAQTWQRLLFAHFRVDEGVLRPMIPPELEIDTVDGEAWVSVVPFLMNHVRLRGIPPFPTTRRFPELNLRTYVKNKGRAGVWFFSLDAASWLAVQVARAVFHLPYFHAAMSLDESGETIHYQSNRTHRNAPPARFSAHYQPTGPVQDYDSDSLDRWLSDRYVLYAANRHGRVFVAHITHLPWPIQPAEADLQQNEIIQAAGIPLLDAPPLFHYVHHLDVLAWPLQTV